jgi:hypothetical protein
MVEEAFPGKTGGRGGRVILQIDAANARQVRCRAGEEDIVLASFDVHL